MNAEELLRAKRDVHLLVPRPGSAPAGKQKFWSMQLGGLDKGHLNASVSGLRQRQLKPDVPSSKQRNLKPTDLYQALAITLGARTYEDWLESEIPRILNFLASNGMRRPADLITWEHAPGFAGTLTAQRLADRLFNSGLPLPQRIFTGVGSWLFSARGYGRLDVNELAEKQLSDEERLEWCERHADEVVVRAVHMKSPGGPVYLDLTGRMLMLNAVSEIVGGMYHLLGPNLVMPMSGEPVFRTYNTSPQDDAFDRRLFKLFRAEIERSSEGWVEVIPLPGNDRIVFLKGADGAFDWVVKEQRDKPLDGNPLFPMLKHDELPSAMREPILAAFLYFRPGEWRELLEHEAEQRHYAEGGSGQNWPGYDTLLLRELVATQRYVPPRKPSGGESSRFACHRLQDRCLMVSELVTIDEFWRFYEHSEWRLVRAERARKAGQQLDEDLAAVNRSDPDHLPASVTWFDAIAFCRYYEQQTGLPVRLLDIEEWRQVCPPPARDITKGGWGNLTWAVTGGDGVVGTDTVHRHAEGGVLRFGRELVWVPNREGLQFLSVVDFGEWLAGYRTSMVPVANAATGRSLMTGPLERDLCPAGSTMRYKGLKVGFRMCYDAVSDS